MIYFTSDVHLGLQRNNPEEREARFIAWLAQIPRSKDNILCLLGDVWDFWYEYPDVIPSQSIRVLAQLLDLVDNGVRVILLPGNHDVWCYKFFQSVGIEVLPQGAVIEYAGTRISLAHGDIPSISEPGFKVLHAIFHSRFCQWCFSRLHPNLAFRLGYGWSRKSRSAHIEKYQWKGREEKLYRYVEASKISADIFAFGHFHVSAMETLDDGRKMFVLDDWIDTGSTPYVTFDGQELKVYR